MERRFFSLNEQEIYEDKIMEWIDDHFVWNEVEIEDHPDYCHQFVPPLPSFVPTVATICTR